MRPPSIGEGIARVDISMRESSLRGKHLDAFILEARRELFRWSLMRAHTKLRHFPMPENEFAP